MLDQRLLPHRVECLCIKNVAGAVDAIATLACSPTTFGGVVMCAIVDANIASEEFGPEAFRRLLSPALDASQELVHFLLAVEEPTKPDTRYPLLS